MMNWMRCLRNILRTLNVSYRNIQIISYLSQNSGRKTSLAGDVAEKRHHAVGLVSARAQLYAGASGENREQNGELARFEKLLVLAARASSKPASASRGISQSLAGVRIRHVSGAQQFDRHQTAVYSNLGGLSWLFGVPVGGTCGCIDIGRPHSNHYKWRCLAGSCSRPFVQARRCSWASGRRPSN